MKNSLILAIICCLLGSSALNAQINLEFSFVQPTCHGYTNGSASVTASGGTAPYSYLWNNGHTGSDISGLAAGNYQATITDANGQTANGSVVVTQPDELIASIVGTNVTCNGENGTLSAQVTGGTGEFSYLWSTQQTDQAISITEPGNYYVTVSDANGCSDVADYLVPGVIVIDMAITHVRCFSDPNSGALNPAVTGGVAPYTYLWGDGNTQPIRQNLPAGTYWLTVTGANGCAVVEQATITMPPPLQATVISITPSCGGANNGSATILATGGTPPYTHTWTPGGYTGSTVTGLAPGQYYVCTFDANQCQVDLWVIIPEITHLDVHLAVQSAECQGVDNGVVTALVVPPGNYNYQWNVPPYTGVTTLTGLAAGTFVAVTVTDPVSGCTGTASATVSGHHAVDVAVVDTDIPCAGQALGTATATASNGTQPYTFQWTAPPSLDVIGTDAQITGLAAGAYQVSVTDSRGCTAIGVANISIESAPDAKIGGLTTLVCGVDTSKVQLVNLSTDPYSSIASWNWTLTINGNTQTFANISPLQLNLPVGDTLLAELKVTSATGCTDTETKQFIVAGIPDVSLTVGPIAFNCENDPVYFDVEGHQPYYSYLWTPTTNLVLDSIPPNATANPNVTTTYQLITNNQGCIDTLNVTVFRVTPIELSVDQSPGFTCDSTYTLFANSNVSNVIWIDHLGNPVGNPPTNPVNVSLDSTTTFTAIATDTLGCVDSLQLTIILGDVQVSIDPAFPGNGCAGEPITLGIINHDLADTLTFHWTVSPPLIINNPQAANPTVSGPTGIYTVFVAVENQFGCTDSLELEVNINDMNYIQQDIAVDLCNGKIVQFINNSGLTGTWYFGDGDSSQVLSPTHTYQTAGPYHVQFVPDITVCVMPWDSTIQVKDTSLLAAEIEHNYLNCINQAEIQFNETSGNQGISWSWTFSGGTPGTSNVQNPVITFTEEGQITAQVIISD
ncbi:MAG: hypothetical protein JNJ57_15650, partial [Saprospiraceae bacterium]|nr:hypothetical protein [Saprospiraceae bacterium]